MGLWFSRCYSIGLVAGANFGLVGDLDNQQARAYVGNLELIIRQPNIRIEMKMNKETAYP